MISTWLRKSSSFSTFFLRSYRVNKVYLKPLFGQKHKQRTPEEEIIYKERNADMSKFYDSIKTFQIQPALDIFCKWKESDEPLHVNIYSSMFSMFRKAEHLPIATGSNIYICF